MINGDGLGEELESLGMTDAQRWPNNASQARDEAAELMAMIKARVSRLRKARLDNIQQADMIEIELWATDALRRLESVGAPTRPESL
jgi:hypothetical protein